MKAPPAPQPPAPQPPAPQPPASQPPAPQPPAPDPQELYEQQVWAAVHLVLAWIREEEKLPLQELLTMVIAAGEPYHLTKFVRVIFERAEAAGVSEKELWPLHEWLRRVARPDLHKRWGDAFNFFYFAELPDFGEHLFFLRGADLSELAQDELESLGPLWEEYADPLPPPPPVPEGATEEEWAPWAQRVQWWRYLIEKGYWYFEKYKGAKVSRKCLAIYWEALQIYLRRLEADDRRWRALLGDDEFPEMPGWNWEDADT